MKHKIYAKVNADGIVVGIYSDVFGLPTGICVGEGNGDEYIHPANMYQLMDEQLRFNYKLVNNRMVLRSDAEKENDSVIKDAPKSELDIVREEVTKHDQEISNVEESLESNNSSLYELTEQLLNAQAELTDKSQELEKTKSDLTKTKGELTKTKNELDSQKSAYQELTDYVLNLDARITEIENK